MTYCHMTKCHIKVLKVKRVVKMPKETFLNLPEEKKDRILKAIKAEFARVPYDKVSINKIVKNAEIPRGSFYMYFEDKDDMLEYSLSSFYDGIKLIALESLKENSGDIFALYNDILYFIIDNGLKEEDMDFFSNIFTNQKVKNSIILEYSTYSNRHSYLKQLNQNLDTKELNIQNENDLYSIMDIILAVVQKTIVDIYLDTNKKKEILEEYDRKIAILKQGMLKKI